MLALAETEVARDQHFAIAGAAENYDLNVHRACWFATSLLRGQTPLSTVLASQCLSAWNIVWS
jgi:hypothetical protein